MQIVAITISILSLGLSGFTFYWTSLRVKKRFYIVGINRFEAFLTPEFALVNGGTKDILITSLICGFTHKDGMGRIYPKQHIDIGSGNTLLLSADKAMHCKVQFTDEMQVNDFVKHGEIHGESKPPIYKMKLAADIKWIDHNGTEFSTSADIGWYGRAEDGISRLHLPITRKFDLYKLAKSWTSVGDHS